MTWKPRSSEEYGAIGVIAVDTNVVVRLLARDDETQYQASRALFETQEIFGSLVFPGIHNLLICNDI